jgi:hypothetical protein
MKVEAGVRILVYVFLMAIVEGVAIFSAFHGFPPSGIVINSDGYSKNSIPVIIAYNIMLPIGDWLFSSFWLLGLFPALMLGFLGWFIIFAIVGEAINKMILKRLK